MNPRQRRGIIFMILAGLSALLMFFVAVSYVGSVNEKVSPTQTVYRVTEELAAYSVIEEDDLEPVEIPQRWTASQASTDLEALLGRRVAFNVAEGTYMSDDMILPGSSLNENEREIALTVDAKTGIAGRVRSGDFVDVYAVFGDSPENGSSRVLVRNVRVVSVAGVETRTAAGANNEVTQQQVVPVTLALEPTAALSISYADAFAATVRLVGLPPGANTQDRSDERNKVDGGDLDLPGGS